MKTKKAKKAIGKVGRKRRGSRPRTGKVIPLIAGMGLRTTKAPWHLNKATTVPPVEHHEDARGTFTTVENVKSFGHPIGSVAVLVRKAGTVAAEHRHEREGHTCYLVSGEMRYRERLPLAALPYLDIGVVRPGIGIFTPPNVDHAFLFTQDSVVVVVANISRTQAEYEADVTRYIEKGEKPLFSDDDIAVAKGEAMVLPPPSDPFGLPRGIAGKTGQLNPDTILDGEEKPE